MNMNNILNKTLTNNTSLIKRQKDKSNNYKSRRIRNNYNNYKNYQKK